MHIRVTCAIIEQDERVLVTQRSAKMALPFLWEFPGGKIEPGETEEECLVREIREELHLHVIPVKRLTPVVQESGSKTIELIPFICYVEGGDILLAEHQAYEWAEPVELNKYTWCPADMPIVEEYVRLKLKTNK